jgi:peroxidase
MNFVRSMVGPRSDCSLGYADQLNQITHFLDNSNVYGSTMEDHKELRQYRDGRLKTDQFYKATENNNNNGETNTIKSKGLLPVQNADVGDECTEPERGTFCFNAGDLRVNEMIGLTVTHLLWFREHNRLAGILKGLNSHWNDERIFIESRRILNAQYQHIIYNEWLPIIVGRTYMEVYGILPQANGYLKYDDSIEPGVSNAFSAAAFRMGHSLIQGLSP